jgi:rhomboid family protein
MFFPIHDVNPMRHLARPIVTWSLIAANVLIFAAQSALPAGAEANMLASFGLIPAVVGNAVADPFPDLPAWTTFLTYAFLHADPWHLLTNMVFLWVFGDNVEDAMGHLKFLTFFFACAAAAAFTHILFNSTSTAPLVGASGAISGIIGAYLVLYPRVRVYMLVRIVIPLPIPIPALWALGAWIGVQLFNALVPTMEPVAWWAHLGGAATGALLVGLFKRPEVELFGRPRP